MEFCTTLSSARSLGNRAGVGEKLDLQMEKKWICRWKKMDLQMEKKMDLQTYAVQQSSESPLGNKETEPVSFPAFQGALFIFLHAAG